MLGNLEGAVYSEREVRERERTRGKRGRRSERFNSISRRARWRNRKTDDLGGALNNNACRS